MLYGARSREVDAVVPFHPGAVTKEEIARLKSKVGEITMDNELLYAKIAALEGKRPLTSRRSRR